MTDEVQEKSEDKASIRRTLKRPGLYAVRAVLENAQIGWANFSSLSEITDGVKNRRDLLAYIRLLETFGWIELKKYRMPTLRRGWKSLRFYDITEKGRAFLDLFPKEQ